MNQLMSLRKADEAAALGTTLRFLQGQLQTINAMPISLVCCAKLENGEDGWVPVWQFLGDDEKEVQEAAKAAAVTLKQKKIDQVRSQIIALGFTPEDEVLALPAPDTVRTEQPRAVRKARKSS